VFESSLLLFHYLDLQNILIILIEPLIVESIPVLNINVSSVATQLTLNGTVPFTSVEPAIRLPLDTHPKHAEDARMTTEFEAILMLKGNTMETSWENVEKHVIGSCSLFKKIFYATLSHLLIVAHFHHVFPSLLKNI
jgi:hypothetical protein